MKKFLTALLLVALLLQPLAALAENWYLEKGVSLANHVQTLAADESFIQLYSVYDADVMESIRSFANSDFSKPVSARMLSLQDTETAAMILSLIQGEEYALSEVAEAEVLKRLPSMFINAINSRFGVNWIVTASVLTTSETHILPEDFQPGALMLQYPGDWSVAIAFSQTGESTVTATAIPICSDYLSVFTDSEELSALEMLGLNMLFQKIELE